MRLAITLLVMGLTLAPTCGVAYAQAPDQPDKRRCTLTVRQFPGIRGTRLGMTAEQVFALFFGSGERTENRTAISSAAGYPNYGVATLFLQPAALPEAKEKLAGIASMSVILFDDRVTDIRVSYLGPSSYPKGPYWLKVDDFIAKLSEAFALPNAKEWIEHSETSKTLKCDGFDLNASTYGGAGALSLRVTPYAYLDTVRQRAAADEDRRRREFKP